MMPGSLPPRERVGYADRPANPTRQTSDYRTREKGQGGKG